MSSLVTSARVITAAALIMVFVFGSFLLNGDPTSRIEGAEFVAERDRCSGSRESVPGEPSSTR